LAETAFDDNVKGSAFDDLVKSDFGTKPVPAYVYCLMLLYGLAAANTALI